MSRHSARNAFTLAEVAFSIAIIGLAVVVSMAVFASGIKAHSQTSLRMVAAATATYLMDVGLGRNFATSDPVPPPRGSLLTNISTVVTLLSGATTWDGVTIIPTEFRLEDPLGGVDKIPSDEFVLKSADFGNPAANLIFKVSRTDPVNDPNPPTNPPNRGAHIRWSKLSIWGCDWRNKPSGISMRAPLLGEFMYYDYISP